VVLRGSLERDEERLYIPTVASSNPEAAGQEEARVTSIGSGDASDLHPAIVGADKDEGVASHAGTTEAFLPEEWQFECCTTCGPTPASRIYWWRLWCATWKPWQIHAIAGAHKTKLPASLFFCPCGNTPKQTDEQPFTDFGTQKWCRWGIRNVLEQVDDIFVSAFNKFGAI